MRRVKPADTPSTMLRRLLRDVPHMVRAREAILSRGGAKQSNVFTRILLALYGVTKWTSVPVMPVEIMLLPRWFPFHLSKISYWGRTVIVPLLVLQALKPLARNRRATSTMRSDATVGVVLAGIFSIACKEANCTRRSGK